MGTNPTLGGSKAIAAKSKEKLGFRGRGFREVLCKWWKMKECGHVFIIEIMQETKSCHISFIRGCGVF